jgi:hypothetical protein
MTTTASRLSAPRRQLIELCQRIGFGRIEHLAVQNGEPRCDLQANIVSEIKLGTSVQRPAALPPDFTLKPQVIELLSWFDLMRDGRIRRLEVKHGLPFALEIDGVLAA